MSLTNLYKIERDDTIVCILCHESWHSDNVQESVVKYYFESHKYIYEQIKNNTDKKSSCLHIIISNDYLTFKFIKEIIFIKMVVYKFEEIIKLNEISELFSYLFVSVDNDTFITFHDNFEYLLLNTNIKFAKIYFKGNIIFETNDFMNLFN